MTNSPPHTLQVRSSEAREREEERGENKHGVGKVASRISLDLKRGGEGEIRGKRRGGERGGEGSRWQRTRQMEEL